MNLERVLRITSFYYLLTGYQIHWFDRKTLRYNITLWCIIYYLMLFLIYLICFAHHFENSVLLKIVSDMSPFLGNLVRFHVILSLKAIIYFISEWKHLYEINNGLVRLLDEDLKNKASFDQQELLAYAMFFSTFIVFCGFCLYIAIVLNFELPPIDHIMINMALFLPHFIIAGCLRFYTLGLWLLKGELLLINQALEDIINSDAKDTHFTVIEILNPVFDTTTNNNKMLEFYAQLSQRIASVAKFIQSFDSILQRHLSILIGLNFNCFLAGFYSRLYYETSWKVLFENRNRRIFYAANSAIFACILVDYAVLLFSRWSFCKSQQNLLNIISKQLFGDRLIATEIKQILKSLTYELKENLKLRLFGLVEFNMWNFITIQGWTITIIALIIGYQYFSDQIIALNESLKFNDDV